MLWIWSLVLVLGADVFNKQLTLIASTVTLMGLFAVLMTSCTWPTQCLGMLSLELQDVISTPHKVLLIQFIGKDPDAGKDWRWEEKGATEDEIIGWHHWLNACEFEQILGDSEGQGSLACCSPNLFLSSSINSFNLCEIWGTKS